MAKEQEKKEAFPLSKTTSVRGNRRVVREKILQILVSHYISKTNIDILFEHIFVRDFLFDKNDDKKIKENSPEKLLTRAELDELFADKTIDWREQDLDFGKNLLDCCIKNQDLIDSTLKIISENWDFERVAIIDRAIIVIGASEMLCFEDIPLKVTLNEAIELAKKFSTEKSSIFVNGILEKIKNQFKEENKITKSLLGNS